MNPSPETLAVAAALLATIAAYALFAGADFGGGIWDLLAGGPSRGSRPRDAIDTSLNPVWEGNQVWIVLGLVLLWTAFSPAFGAIMTTLFIPLSLSLLGIVLRGVGFAFRHEAERLPMRSLAGGLFAASSVLAPFFLGVCVGAVATGRVTAGGPVDEVGAWTTPTALLTGALFVCACAYIGAVYLVGDCHRRDEPDLVAYFSRRAVAAGVLTGALAGATFALLSWSSPYVFDRLIGVALPLVIVSMLSGAGALAMIVLGRPWALRIFAALAVACVVAGWGWAQYPYLLPTSLTLGAGSAPVATLNAELAVIGMAALFVVPAFVYLYWLQQHGRLTQSPSSGELRAAVAAQSGAAGDFPGTEPAPDGKRGRGAHPVVTTAVLALAAGRLVRDLVRRR